MCDFVPFTEKVVRAKDVFAERNVTISVLKRLEWFGQLSYLLMYAVQYVWK